MNDSLTTLQELQGKLLGEDQELVMNYITRQGKIDSELHEEIIKTAKELLLNPAQGLIDFLCGQISIALRTVGITTIRRKGQENLMENLMEKKKEPRDINGTLVEPDVVEYVLQNSIPKWELEYAEAFMKYKKILEEKWLKITEKWLTYWGLPQRDLEGHGFCLTLETPHVPEQDWEKSFKIAIATMDRKIQEIK